MQMIRIYSEDGCVVIEDDMNQVIVLGCRDNLGFSVEFIVTKLAELFILKKEESGKAYSGEIPFRGQIQSNSSNNTGKNTNE